MKYYLIVGEASGDLHASHLMAALKVEDPQAEFRFFGGDLMAAVGGTMVKHYKELLQGDGYFKDLYEKTKWVLFMTDDAEFQESYSRFSDYSTDTPPTGEGIKDLRTN